MRQQTHGSLARISLSKDFSGSRCFMPCGRWVGRSVEILYLLAILSLFAGGVGADSRASDKTRYDEYQLKAAYLYNFTKFIYWPEGTQSADNSAFNLCVLGDNIFGDDLLRLESETVAGMPIEVIYPAKASDALQCQLLFVSQSKSRSYKEVLSLLEGHPIVTVSDIEGFVRTGGIIELSIAKGSVSFKINQKVAVQNNLDIKASLLSLASFVIKDRR